MVGPAATVVIGRLNSMLKIQLYAQTFTQYKTCDSDKLVNIK